MAKKQGSISYEIKFPKKYISIIFVLILVLGLVYFSKKFLVVATVNDKSINRFSLIKKLEKQGGKKVLDSMVTESLIRQEAEKRKINVSQKEIDAELKKIEANITSQGSTLDQALQNQGMTKNDLIDQIQLQLLLQKMVGNDIKISDKEIEEAINASKNQQGFEGQEITKEQATTQLKQQKTQQKIQSFLTDLKTKAKINYFINF